MADAQTRHGRGIFVVALLAVLFFTLLGMIILRSGDARPKKDAASETLTVLPVKMRIRTEPNARAPVVATASAGDRVTLVQDRGAWVRVRTADGLSGWADRSSLERTVEQQRRLARYEAIRRLPPLEGFASERTQLYSGPGIFYSIVGELDDGGKVTVYTRDHDYYAIAYGKGIAYADVDAIDVSSAGAQLDVRTDGATPPPETATIPPEVAERLPETPVEPVPIPEPVPEPREPEPASGVYAAVPRGGTQPQEIERSIPRYPATARRAGIEGPVVVRGIVRRDGTIDNVEVIKDLPHGLGEEARRAVSRWRFRPATYQGEPIDVYYTVTVNFRLR
jgi:TonB family protein